MHKGSDTKDAEIIKQISLKGGATRILPDGSDDFTAVKDLAAFRQPGGRNLHFPISPPDGVTDTEFANDIISAAESYVSPWYALLAGPNSNSAAAFPIISAGGKIPDVKIRDPGRSGQWGAPVYLTPGLNYWDSSLFKLQEFRHEVTP